MTLISEEQRQLQQVVRHFLAEHSPEAEVRRLMDTADGYDPVIWKRMAAELGLQALIIPQDYGGTGASLFELVLVMEEMGQALLCAPFLSTVGLAATALLAAGTAEAKERFLPDIAAGRTVATLAFTEDDGAWQADSGTLHATSSGGLWTLSGHKSFVLDGHTADVIFVTARADEGLGLFAVPADAPCLTRTLLPTLDATRKQARLEFAGTPAQLVSAPGAAEAGVSTALQQAAILLAAEQTGGAQRCLDLSVAYARTRTQFDRPIGSFQAIKHKCVEMLVAVECSRTAAYHGADVAAEGGRELAMAAAAAQSYCSEAFARVAAETIQVHGGIGFTWEHPAHLFYRRAHSSEQLLGNSIFHRAQLAQLLDLTPA